jgi:cytoskeletal protein CcmA (bactofilin family)
MSYRPAGQPSGFGEGLSQQTAQVPEAFSLVDRHSSIEGTFATKRDLRIEGEMRGTLRCQGLLYVAEGADVDATVEAANIAVAGQLRGSITCHGKLQIMPTGRVIATVVTETLVINEGAIYEGDLRMEDRTAQFSAEPSSLPADENASMLRRFGGEEASGLPAPRRSRAERGERGE